MCQTKQIITFSCRCRPETHTADQYPCLSPVFIRVVSSFSAVQIVSPKKPQFRTKGTWSLPGTLYLSLFVSMCSHQAHACLDDASSSEKLNSPTPTYLSGQNAHYTFFGNISNLFICVQFDVGGLAIQRQYTLNMGHNMDVCISHSGMYLDSALPRRSTTQ